MPRTTSHHVVLLALLGTGTIGTTAGCAVLGSHAIRNGRLSYNEAIAYTEAQQLLLNILRTRYAEPTTALAVASVTANATVHAETGINLGFGPKDSYSGNLVPFSGGFYYEENPTIAYLPVQGEDSIRRLMAPIPLDITVSLLRSPLLGAQFLSTLVSRINDLRNPDFLSAATAPPDPRFHRLVDLVTSLHRHGHLFWVTRPKNDNAFAVAAAMPPTTPPRCVNCSVSWTCLRARARTISFWTSRSQWANHTHTAWRS